jgi:hypothetical protein
MEAIGGPSIFEGLPPAMPAKGRPPSAVAVIMAAIEIMQAHLPYEVPGSSSSRSAPTTTSS